MRITIGGDRVEISTQKESDPKVWDAKLGRLTGTREAVGVINAYLDGLVTKVYTAQNDLIRANITVTANAIRNKLSGKDAKARMLVSIFEQHNKDMAKLVDKEYSPTTLIRCNTTLQHVIEFMKNK